MRRAVGETRRTINKIQQPCRCALSWGDMLILICTALGPPSLSWITCNLYFCTPSPCRWEKLHHQMRFIFPPSSPSARLKLVCLWWQEASGLHQIREHDFLLLHCQFYVGTSDTIVVDNAFVCLQLFQFVFPFKILSEPCLKEKMIRL